MTSFSLYRLPRQQQVTLVAQTSGLPEQLNSCVGLSGEQGFVVAPFSVTAEHPILVIRPDRLQHFAGAENLDSIAGELGSCVDAGPAVADVKTTDGRADYAIDFANFHSQLRAGAFSKIVLARCAEMTRDEALSPLALFQRACRLYPRLFISLVWTPQSGLWLTATPEILLDGDGREWRTIALAGTMQLEGDDLRGEGENVRWSVKNIQEQRIVATYVTECLERFACDFHEEGPRTVRAASLVHLRSDFTFSLATGRVGELLQELHPTPAVCGLPKRETCRFILGNEHQPRLYYSGFMGPYGMKGGTHLYVSLRCMQMVGTRCRLFAGGGLLKDSIEQQEWQETVLKMETMRRLLLPE